MARDPFDGPKLKVQRANRHILDFRAAVEALFEANFQTETVMEADLETGHLLSPKITLPQPSPDMLLTAADAIYNLRSALDQVVCRSVVATGKTPEGTYFPHGKNMEGFNVSISKRCENVPEAVCGVITALEPYYGGKGYLFRVLHDLNLVDKHTDLLSFGWSSTLRVEFSHRLKTPDREGRTDIIEGADPADIHTHQNLQLNLAVTFAGIEAIDGEPAGTLLRQLCDLVWQTIGLIQDATRMHMSAQ